MKIGNSECETEVEPILTDMEDGSSVAQIAQRLGVDPANVIIISKDDLSSHMQRAILAKTVDKKLKTVDKKLVVVDSSLEDPGIIGEMNGMQFFNGPIVKKEKDPGRISGLIPKHHLRSKKWKKKLK